MNSYEIEINGELKPITTIKNLTGHKIEPYKIHADKSVPNFKIDYPERMLENEYYAIETFSSTGSGITSEGNDCSHFMIDYNKNYKDISLANKDKKYFEIIESKFSTLAFCNRWFNDYSIPNKVLKNLCATGIINKYPPLNDIKGNILYLLKIKVI